VEYAAEVPKTSAPPTSAGISSVSDLIERNKKVRRTRHDRVWIAALEDYVWGRSLSTWEAGKCQNKTVRYDGNGKVQPSMEDGDAMVVLYGACKPDGTNLFEPGDPDRGGDIVHVRALDSAITRPWAKLILDLSEMGKKQIEAAKESFGETRSNGSAGDSR
jgi:hypothetical protein